MADTAFLRYGVEPWVREQLAARYGQAFSSQVLDLTSGGSREFDAVSRDGSVVAAIKTSSGLTSGGKFPGGKVNSCIADLYYLTLVDVPTRLLVLTDPEFHDIFTNRMTGAVANGIDVELLVLPPSIQKRVDQIRDKSSAEMAGPAEILDGP